MLNSLLHYYLLFNGAIATSYLLTRASLLIKFFQAELSQTSKLKLMRYCFVITFITFVLMPKISNQFNLPSPNFTLHPLLKHASISFLQHPIAISTDFLTAQYTPTTFSMSYVLCWLWLIGFIFCTIHFTKNLYTLHVIYSNSAVYHQLKNICIFFSAEIPTPFCWAFLRKKYIALPNNILEKPQHIKIAIRHELQHIRQKDTLWLQAMYFINLFCYWNPFIKLWSLWMKDQQEFACDEALITSKATSPVTYAHCLLETAIAQSATVSAIGMSEFSQLKLYRRIDMLFNYKKPSKRLMLIAAYCLSMLTITTAAFAITHTDALSADDVKALIINANYQEFHLSNKTEVVSLINQLRKNPQEKAKMQAALQRMHKYQDYIQSELKLKNMPTDLLALPLVESGYQALDEKVNPVKAAGIWQIIPNTAHRLGLSTTATRDERLNTELSTKAALNYLTALYEQFHDWKLAVVAYEIGEQETARLIKETKSRDPWTFTKVNSLPAKMKNELTYYLALFDATVIIIHHPDLLS